MDCVINHPRRYFCFRLYHVGELLEQTWLLMVFEVPLKSGYEVDGYFHVLAPEDRVYTHNSL